MVIDNSAGPAPPPGCPEAGRRVEASGGATAEVRPKCSQTRPASAPSPSKTKRTTSHSIAEECRGIARGSKKYSRVQPIYDVARLLQFVGYSNDRHAGPASERPEAENAVDRVEAGDDPLADQIPQCLRGAAAQRAVARAAVESRYRELVGKAVAAMHLDGVARDLERHLVAGHLGNRRQ